MELGLRHAALFGGLGGALVFAVVAITGASVAVTYLLLLVMTFLIVLMPAVLADPERREARRQARRGAAPKQR